MNTAQLCSAEDCARAMHGRGLCRSHYMKWWRYGDPLAGGAVRGTWYTGRPLVERIQKWTVDPITGCWLWSGDRRNGYGSVWDHGTRFYAHRVMYEMSNGAISDDQVIRHTCDTPACVNPSHLLAGSQADNARDMSERGRWRNQHAAGPNNGKAA